MLKYLRIAVTSLSLTACLLLIALWVRSHHKSENVILPGGNRITLLLGRLYINEYFQVSDNAVVPIPPFRISAGNPVPQGDGISLTIWHLCLFAGVLAAIPWIHWRFSLRTLLMDMTLVAVALGLVVLLT